MGVVALDTETTGVGYHDTVFCVSAAWRDKGTLQSHAWKASGIDLLKVLDGYSGFVFHNAKFDLQKLEQAGILTTWNWYDIHDTECMSHLLDEQRPKALKKLAKTVLDLDTDEEEELRKARRKLGLTKADGYDRLPWEVLEPYARKDAEFTLLLYEHFWPQIQASEELLALYKTEQELMGVLYKMEQKGIGIDKDYVDAQCKELADILLRTDLELRDMVGKEDFNPNSWQQITEAFAERDIRIADTSKETLSEIDDPLAYLLLEYRHATKLYNTYFRAIREETREGILHPNFRQWGTRGRRFSAGAALE